MFKNFPLIIIISLLILFLQQNNNCIYAQIETAQIQNLNIELNNASFQKSNVYKLSINANNVDFSSGRVGTVSINTLGFQKNELILDELNLILKDVSFNTENLFSKKELLLNQPVNGSAYILVTENGLNTILNQPKVLDKFSNLATAKIQKFGIELNSGLVSFKEPVATILPNNVIQIDMIASLAGLINCPVSFSTTLGIYNSKLMMTSPKMITSGILLPEDIAQKINDKLNSLMDIGEKLEDDLDIKITSLNMIPRNRIVISADALIKKLKFSKKEKVNN